MEKQKNAAFSNFQKAECCFHTRHRVPAKVWVTIRVAININLPMASSCLKNFYSESGISGKGNKVKEDKKQQNHEWFG